MRSVLPFAIAAACVFAVGGSRATADPAHAKTQRIDGSTRALYVRAWHECYAEFSGYRGPAGSNIALPAFESCFKQKTGRYPFQLSRP
jgi:hypothetical protein